MTAMKRTHLPLSALRAFEAAARHESFAHAADELSITQPAVSKQVSLLEDRLGVQLFDRAHRSVCLTGHGKRLAPRVTDALERLRLALEDTMNSEPSAEPLTVLVESDFALLWLMPRLPLLESLVPDTPVSIVTRIDPTELDDDVAPRAILWGNGWWDNCESEPLFTNTAFPVCTPQFAEELRANPAALHRMRLIHDRTTDWWKHAAIALDMPDLNWMDGTVYNQTSLCLEAARTGAGITIGDEVSCRWYLERGLLTIPFRISQPCPLSYYFLWRSQGGRHDHDTALLRDWLAEQASEHRRWITEFWNALPA